MFFLSIIYNTITNKTFILAAKIKKNTVISLLSYYLHLRNHQGLIIQSPITHCISNDCIASLAATMEIFSLFNSSDSSSLLSVSVSSIALNFLLCNFKSSDSVDPVKVAYPDQFVISQFKPDTKNVYSSECQTRRASQMKPSKTLFTQYLESSSNSRHTIRRHMYRRCSKHRKGMINSLWLLCCLSQLASGQN